MSKEKKNQKKPKNQKEKKMRILLCDLHLHIYILEVILTSNFKLFLSIYFNT